MTIATVRNDIGHRMIGDIHFIAPVDRGMTAPKGHDVSAGLAE